MARCNCSSVKCSCIIKQGPNITVTGAGRADNPYVISGAADGSGGGGGFDTGDLKWSARASAPVGWLVANGAAVSRTVYADLFAAVSTLYGAGDGSTTFNLPDYTGRFMLGADASYAAGSSGGSETKTLNATQLPAHAHTIAHDHPAFFTAANGSHEHDAGTASADGTNLSYAKRGGPSGSFTRNGGLIDAAGTHTHTVNIPAYTGNSGTTGGGQPVNVMPPYTTALPLIKT